MPEPLLCTSRKHREVRDTAALVHMDTCKISQETSNAGPSSAQLPPGKASKTPHVCLDISPLCARSWRLHNRRQKPGSVHLLWHSGSAAHALKLVPTTQQCPCQLASVLLTSRRSGHGGSAKISKTTGGAQAGWSSSAQNGQPHALCCPHLGGAPMSALTLGT